MAPRYMPTNTQTYNLASNIFTGAFEAYYGALAWVPSSLAAFTSTVLTEASSAGCPRRAPPVKPAFGRQPPSLTLADQKSWAAGAMSTC
jgi:hypothetical protein